MTGHNQPGECPGQATVFLATPPTTARPAPPPDLIPDNFQVILDERVPVFSIGLGNPGPEVVAGPCLRHTRRAMQTGPNWSLWGSVSLTGAGAHRAEGTRVDVTALRLPGALEMVRRRHPRTHGSFPTAL